MDVKSRVSLRSLFRVYRKQIFFTYTLFGLEYTIILLQPFVLGRAIDQLIRGVYEGLVLYAFLHLVHLLIGTYRRIYDTSVFSVIFSRSAVKLAQRFLQNGQDKSKTLAQVNLSKELINFFETDLKVVFDFAYSVIGSLIVLAFYDLYLVLFCCITFIPEFFINYYYIKKIRLLHKQLNDQTEKELTAIESKDLGQIENHFFSLSRIRIRLSSSEAKNFAYIEIFILTLLVLSLLHYCQVSNTSPGQILAVFQYVIRFVNGIDVIPSLLKKITRIQDIQQRIASALSEKDDVRIAGALGENDNVRIGQTTGV